MEILSKRIKLLREEQGLSQGTVSKAASITSRTYIRYEHGEREPNATAVAALARFFGVSADYLLGLKDER